MGGAAGLTRTVDTRVPIVKTYGALVNMNIVVFGRIEQETEYLGFLIFIQSPFSGDGLSTGS
ncbi:MAG: hypothetical protein WC647_17865 [Desulfomonilaceae bacterium]|jgi:hypothetical protein